MRSLRRTTESHTLALTLDARRYRTRMPVDTAAVKTLSGFSFTDTPSYFGYTTGRRSPGYTRGRRERGRLRSLFVSVGRAKLTVGIALVVEAALRLGLLFLLLLAVAAKPRKGHRLQALFGDFESA
jgi:hypothetical protein